MTHVLPVKIECRWCLGDGWVSPGGINARPAKVQCPTCKGSKHEWVQPSEVRPSDVVLRR